MQDVGINAPFLSAYTGILRLLLSEIEGEVNHDTR
nr:MAG TPA: hypothetical protein [Caudoviricetes sp.]